MRALLAAAVVLAAGLCAGADDKDKKYTSKDGKFVAKFPEEPKVVKQMAGQIQLVITIVEKGKGGYGVIYSDMPAEVVKAAPAAKLLEGGEKGLVDNFKAKVTKSSETTFKSGDKKHPAREILAEKDDTHLRVLIILIENRLYQVIVVGPKDFVSNKDADEFVKSFDLAG